MGNWKRMRRWAKSALSVAIAGVAGVGTAHADPPYMIGDRWFPVTPLVESPFVADGVYGAVQHLRQSDSPDFGENDFVFGVEKRVTDDFGVSLAATYEVLAPQGMAHVYGFDNVYAEVKYEVVRSVPHEAILSLGLTREFGGTGAARVGAEAVGMTTPAILAAKGFGDLPDSLKYLRPVTVSANLGYVVPDAQTSGDDHFPNVLQAAVSVQYSLPYLQGNVEYAGLPPVLGRISPLVEFTYSAPTGTAFDVRPSGLVAPGFVYTQDGIDFSIEALLPVSHYSGVGVGAIGKVHIPLGMIAETLGKPLFAN
jgi:hypothetical protein